MLKNKTTYKKMTAWTTAAALLLSSAVVPQNAGAKEVPLVSNYTSVKYMPAGSSFQLLTNTDNKKVSFTSDKKSVATVSSDGLIMAKKKGTTKIRVRCGEKTAGITLKVKSPVGFTISKKAGTYNEAVKTKIKAKKGYHVYYTTSSRFKKSARIKAGKSMIFRFTNTQTLKLLPVRSNISMTAATLNKRAGKDKNRADYLYKICQKNTVNDVASSPIVSAAVPAPTGHSTSVPSAVPDAKDTSSPVPTGNVATTAPIASEEPVISSDPAATDAQPATASPEVKETQTPPVPDVTAPAVSDTPGTTEVPEVTKEPENTPENTPETVIAPVLQPGEEGYAGDTVEGYVSAYAGTFTADDSNLSEEGAVSIKIPKKASKQDIQDKDGNIVGSLSKKNKLSITMPGTYIISSEGSENGETAAATVEVEYSADAAASVSKNLHLILDGVNLTAAPSKTDNGIITIKNGDTDISHAVLTIKGENILNDRGAAELNTDDHTAGIMSKKNVPLTINGSGSLKITSDYGNGIQCKDLLKIQDAGIQITTGNENDSSAGNNGISGKMGLYLKNVNLTIDSAGDALKTTLDAADVAGNASLAGLGNMSICGGTYNLTSRNKDGISVYRTLYLSPEKLEVAADNQSGKEITENTGSCKAVKAGSTIYIPATAGAIKADTSASKGTSQDAEAPSTSDDAFYCDGYICINNSKDLVIIPGRKSVHAGKGILVNGKLLKEKEIEDFSIYKE